jgi:hypothetical protein
MTSETKPGSATLWDAFLALRDEQRENTKGAPPVIKGRDLKQETNQQGLMKWYLHPAIKDTCLSTFMFFEQEIPPGSRSGRIRFQGGSIMIILEGSGYTLVDGVKHYWEEGDVVNLPIRGPGITVQHFNVEKDKPAKFLSVEPNWFACTTVDRSSGFEQLENAPEFKRQA